MEQDPNTATPLIIQAACPVDARPSGAPLLWGGLKIRVSPDSLVSRVYCSSEIVETFTCSYELNPIYRNTLEKSGLKVSGVSQDGGARIVELADHHFFVGTGFVPQMSSEENRPHPLIVAFMKSSAK